MKEINNESKKVPPFEKPIFVIIMTFTGGYMNGYTYITRNKILANMHTANMSKLGINISLRNYEEALSYFLPISACILGSAFSELTKTIAIIKKFITFLILTFSFAVGAIPGTLVSKAINIKAVWVCSIILLIQAFWIYSYEKTIFSLN